MKRISYRETLPLLRHFTKSEFLNFKTESCQSKFNLFFVMAVCLFSVFKNFSYLLKQSFVKLQVMTKSHSFLALGDCTVFFRTWHLCYVFLRLTFVLSCPCLGLVLCFPALGARLCFPCLAPMLCFSRLAPMLCFSRLAPMLCFSRLAPMLCFSRWALVLCFPTLGARALFPVRGALLSFPALGARVVL